MEEKNNFNYPSSMYHERNEKFTHRHPMIPSINFYNVLKFMSLKFRSKIAINCLNLDTTYQNLIDDSIMFSKAFKELGVKKGDVISISLNNVYHAIAAFCAGNRIGAVITFLNPQSTIEQEIFYLNEFESPLLIQMAKDKDYIKNIRSKTKVENIISLDSDDIEKRNFYSSKNTGNKEDISFREIESISKYKTSKDLNFVTGKDDALILFTSGTTGIPKSVVITNENLLASGIYMKNSSHIVVNEVTKSLVVVPFSYPYGFCTSTLMSLLCGMQVILAPTLNNDNISYYYSKNPNYIFGSPAFLELTKRNIPKKQDLSSAKVFISGGDFLFDKEIKEAQKFFEEHNSKIEICNGSGNAESVGASTNSVGIPYKAGTVGKVLTGTHPIIIDSETKMELPYGAEGELCISGKHVFKEYFNEEKLTKETKFLYRNREYIHTGMVGILDKDGYFTITGRASRFYINGDLNKIYLERVQKIISLIKGVESCIAVPKPDADNLYTCKVYIVPTPDITDYNAFVNYLHESFSKQMVDVNGEIVQLKPFEIPTSIELLDKLPRSAQKGDKIDIYYLEQKAKEEAEAELKLSLKK